MTRGPSWHVFAGVKSRDGLEGDGDIYIPDNLVALRDFILRGTDGLGLHLMMADGVSEWSVDQWGE